MLMPGYWVSSDIFVNSEYNSLFPMKSDAPKLSVSVRIWSSIVCLNSNKKDFCH